MSYQSAYVIYLKQRHDKIVIIAKLKACIDCLFEDMIKSTTYKQWVKITKNISLLKAYIKTL